MRDLIWEYLVKVPSNFAIAGLSYTVDLNEVPYGIYSLRIILLKPLDSKDRVRDLLS